MFDLLLKRAKFSMWALFLTLISSLTAMASGEDNSEAPTASETSPKQTALIDVAHVSGNNSPEPLPPEIEGTDAAPEVEVAVPSPEVEAAAPTEANSVEASPLESSFSATAYAGRVHTLELDDPNVVGIEVLNGPEHGNVTVNPDNTIALVLSDTQDTSDVNFTLRLTYEGGSTQDQDVEIDVIAGAQDAGWGMGNFYMLETDEDDRVVVEHGENHQKLHISGNEDALTINDIAILESMDPDDINWKFFLDNPEYGTDPEEPLAQDAGHLAWAALMDGDKASSDWLLLERGYEYGSLGRLFGPGTQGESEINPLYLGAFGEGADPKITSEFSIVKAGAENIVMQGVDFNGLRILNGENILIDDASMSARTNIQNLERFTYRHVDVVDVVSEAPRNGESWSPHSDRESGIFISKSSNILFEDNFFDHNGWADDYDPGGDISGGMPPSMFSHNVYIQSSNFDVTFRDNISMRGSATGVQMRSGGFIEDNVIIDNNGAIMFAGGGTENPGNYTLFTDNLVTSGSHKETDLGQGALTKGISNQAELTSLVDNIITHLADPNNPDEIAAKFISQNPYRSDFEPYYDDTIIHNWVGTKNGEDQDERNLNTEGLEYNVLNETTIQNFAADLLGTETATIEDLANFLRAQNEGQFETVVDADLINAFFQAGFGISTTLREDPETLRFVPSDLGDGMRWDNRLNWSTEDLPGTQDGDSIDLGGNWVYYGGTTTVNDLDFGAGGELYVTHGYLNVDGTLAGDGNGGTINIDGSGQFWTDGYTGTSQLDINVDGGRFANTGQFEGPVDISLSDNAQAILASENGHFYLDADSALTVTGGDVKVGFDGEAGDTGVLLFEEGATLTFDAEDGEISTIREFHSGHFEGAGDDFQSGTDLGGAFLTVDLANLEAGNVHTLMSADEIIGTFGSFDALGLASDQDVSLLVDYDTDKVTLNLGTVGEGSGQQFIYVEGGEFATQDASALWEALTSGHGTYSEAPPDSSMDDDDTANSDYEL
jgi:hypothetical protein